MCSRVFVRNRFAVVLGLCAAFTAFVCTMPGSTVDAAQEGRPGSISGRVTYTDGRPVDRFPIEYRSAAERNERRRARTDTDGRYIIEGLADGVYFIGFFEAARVPLDRNPQAENLPDAAPALSRNGEPKTRRVTIQGGQSVTDIDFVLIDTGQDGDSGNEIPTGPGEDISLPAAGSNRGGAESEVILPVAGALGVVALLAGWFTMRGARHRL